MKKNRNHMKKILLLNMALGLAGASSLMAGTVDVFITGSTAFRANVYSACTKLYSSAPNIYYADGTHGGANSGFSSSTASWVMTGTPSTAITNISGNTLVIHGFFTGSIQGLQTTEQGVQLTWAQPVGTVGGNATSYVTNAPTIGFSDASGSASPYPATGNYVEENVCVQPFVWVKSTATSGAVTTISNMTWEQVYYGIPEGRLPLSAWDFQTADTNKFIYLLQRTKDSGTRRVETQGAYYQFNNNVGLGNFPFIYDPTNSIFYIATVFTNYGYGFASSTTLTNGYATGGAEVIGTEGPGLGNANMNWGSGYIGGGDIKNTLNQNGGANASANQSIAYMSISDGKGVGSGNWANVMSYNGIWPTAAGPAIRGQASTATNDYSPITLGYYPLWGFEVLVHYEAPSSGSVISGQDITGLQLGDQYTPGSFIGVFNFQTANFPGVSPVAGSIENEILASQVSNGATAIPLGEMSNSRPSVGGEIFPPFQ
jgi:hypothetical protein